MHFGISEGNGGLKHGSRPWLGMDIFWNCQMGATKSQLHFNMAANVKPSSILFHKLHVSLCYWELKQP